MGFLDKLGIGGSKQEREERGIRKLQKKTMEKFGPPENRQGAIEELGKIRSARAIEALLMRYTIRVDPGITDDEEKQRVLALIREAGAAVAAEPVKALVPPREPLLKRFLSAHEGSNARVRESLAGLLADSGFDVKGYTPKVEAALPAAYKLDAKGRVVRKV